ncbi:hypothetical protein GEMRC1_005248 [Eukaryota sp. GEM-RC1]
MAPPTSKPRTDDKSELISELNSRASFVASKLGIEVAAIHQKLPHLESGYEIKPATDRSVASLIDHTILKTNATAQQVEVLCKEAIEHNFFSVCVNGSRVAQCCELLKETPVKVAAVIGFPLGAMTTEAKVFETTELVKLGAGEIDMVLNVGFLLDGDYKYVCDEIAAIKKACGDVTLKVIFETCELDRSQVIDCCLLSAMANADFVKTSTGFGKGGATVEHINVMKMIVGDVLEVKASGGVRSYETALDMVYNGATRLGTSSGIAIVSKKTAAGGTY